MAVDPRQQSVLNWVEDRAADLSGWTQLIWELAEPAWREYRSAAWYVDLLRAEGFEVEAGSGGMPTAFAAVWRNGEGPTVASYAEYDAVPGNCQAASTRREPRAGLSVYAPGHTDPHSALGIGALGGALSAKAAMEKHGIGGTLKFFGEPAEKLQGSKPVHALRGYYDGIDAMISFHPCYMMPLCNTTRWDTHCGAGAGKIYSFISDAPETWQADAADSVIPVSHASARAPGANAALFTMYALTKTTQESMLAHTGGWSISEAVLSAGQATADNLPHHIAQIQYLWRTPDIAMQEKIAATLDANARHAAAATHCRLVERWHTRVRPGIANHALASLVYKNLERVGAPQFGDEAIAIAREMQTNLGIKPMSRPFVQASETLIAPQAAEARLREVLPPWQLNFTNDDYADMTWHAPTARLYIGRPMLNPASERPYPHWVMNALGGIPACIDPTVICAAKTVGLSLLELLCRPDAVAAARDEFKRRTGGGIGGAKWIAPLLPEDFQAPIHYRWPDYHERDGKREWWIPTNAEIDRV